MAALRRLPANLHPDPGNNIMSYILDALKKAESERALGSVPGLHAQPVPLVAIDGKPALWRRPLLWAVLGLTLIVAALAWLVPWRTAPTPATVSAIAAAPAPIPAQAVVPLPAAPAPPVVAPPVAMDVAPIAPPAVGTPAKPKTTPKSVVKAKPPAAPAVAAEPPLAKPAPVVTVPAQAPAPAPIVAEERLPSLRDLPPNIQREIPALSIGGYIYASKPAERSVLINNRLLREGDQVAPGLTLEKMMPREAVLNYRGYRYRLPY
jgi:general secretion pathway protein B